MSFITRAYGASKLALKAKSPTIMVVGGVVAMGAAAVMASKQTLKVEEVLSKHAPDLDKIKQGESLDLESYSKEVAQGDRFRVYSRAGFDLAKLYAVPALLFVGGAGLVFGGHRIMLRRNATLAVAFTALERAFDRYRARVIDRYGSEQDQAFAHGSVVKEVYDDKSGKAKTIETRDWDDKIDPYNRIFRQGDTTAWKSDLESNRFFLTSQRRFAQEKLNRQGYLYLDDVYQSLGFPESPISRVVGWKVERLPDGTKNIPHVDFGLDKPHPDDWKYTKEGAVYLDFNCKLIVGGEIQKILERA